MSTGRGRKWLDALASEAATEPVRSVVYAEGSIGSRPSRFIAVVPDPDNPFWRARQGEVGIRESLVLAETVRAAMSEDADAEDDQRKAIVAIVDLPSQAYGRLEETLGLHLTLAAAVDAYAAARSAGHPVIALVVGTALSGGFLAHGLQANQILAFDDPGVEIHAMHKQGAARVTRRTVAELDELAKTVIPLSYKVGDWAKLGYCDELLKVKNPDEPSKDAVSDVAQALERALDRAASGSRQLDRLSSDKARRTRAASLRARAAVADQWD